MKSKVEIDDKLEVVSDENTIIAHVYLTQCALSLMSRLMIDGDILYDSVTILCESTICYIWKF